MYYVIMPTNSDLYHHGIFGQKWGKKNGPPYPLGAGDHSASEKKAGWKKSLKSSKEKKNNSLYKLSGTDFDGDNISIFKTNKSYQKDLKEINKKYRDSKNKEVYQKKLKDAYDSYSKIQKENLLVRSDKKRMDDAAILGLKALNEPTDSNNKWWFLNEDQTIGYPEIADLVLKGKNKKQINEIINNCEKAVGIHAPNLKNTIKKDPKYTAITSLAYVYDADKYIDAVIKNKK